jgi:preprotein translocase subunit SecG
MTLYIIACFVLILFVLLQPGKSDAAAVFGGGANSSAFGPRGTATVMAKITIGAAIVFFLIAFLFAIPSWNTGQKSVGESVPAEPAPAPPPPASTDQAPATTPGAPTEPPAASPQPGTQQPGNSTTGAAPGAQPQTTPQSKQPGAKKPNK